MEPSTEHRMWRQLKPFGIIRMIFTPRIGNTAEEYDTMEQCLAALPPDLDRVFLEATGEKTMHDIPKGPIALITGCTRFSNKYLARPGESYRIEPAICDSMYPTSAAAIALAFRYGQ